MYIGGFRRGKDCSYFVSVAIRGPGFDVSEEREEERDYKKGCHCIFFGTKPKINKKSSNFKS